MVAYYEQKHTEGICRISGVKSGHSRQEIQLVVARESVYMYIYLSEKQNGYLRMGIPTNE